MKSIHSAARLVTVLGAVVAGLGVAAVVAGLALFAAGAFPLAALICILVGSVALSAGPCLWLVNAARRAHLGEFGQAITVSAEGGFILLAESGAAELFTTFSDPCWDSPVCTSSTPLSHEILKVGTIAMLTAAVTALVLSPIVLSIARRSASRAI